MVMNEERRKYPRINDERIALKVDGGDFAMSISQSLNISASGVYCKCDKEIPLMSRVKVMLMLPFEAEQGRNVFRRIETDGVVVREHPVIQEGKVLHYDVAIFFDSLDSKDRENIKEYVGKKGKE